MDCPPYCRARHAYRHNYKFQSFITGAGSLGCVAREKLTLHEGACRAAVTPDGRAPPHERMCQR